MSSSSSKTPNLAHTYQLSCFICDGPHIGNYTFYNDKIAFNDEEYSMERYFLSLHYSKTKKELLLCAKCYTQLLPSHIIKALEINENAKYSPPICICCYELIPMCRRDNPLDLTVGDIHYRDAVRLNLYMDTSVHICRECFVNNADMELINYLMKE